VCQSGTYTGFRWLGASTGTTAKASFDTQFSMAEYSIHQHLLDGALFVRCGECYGTLFQSFVSTLHRQAANSSTPWAKPTIMLDIPYLASL
jgi:predicted metal-binding protein